MDASSLPQLPSTGVDGGALTGACYQRDPVSERPDNPVCTQDGKLVFGRNVKTALEPISELVNKVNPNKVKMLETISSVDTGSVQRKNNFDRIVSVITTVPDEKRSALLTAFSKFLTSNRVADKTQASGIVQEIRDIFTSHGDVEVHNEVKALQNRQELLAQQHAEEKSQFLNMLGQCVGELEPEWFEDRTYVERQGGAYTLHIGQPDTDQATGVSLHIPDGALPEASCRNNEVTFKGGIMHGTTMEKEVSYLISSLRRKELTHDDGTRLADYATTRIRISLGSDHLLSMYLLPHDEGVKIEFLRAGENRLDLPFYDSLNTDVLVKIEDQKVFTALNYCLTHDVEHFRHPMISLENFLKYELITFVGEKQAFLDLLSLFLKSTSSENISP